MIRTFVSLALALLGPTAVTAAQEVHLDPSRGFFCSTDPTATAASETVATTTVGPITRAAFDRYQRDLAAGRAGPRQIRELAFDVLLAAECEKRHIARSAPTLARAMGSRRRLESDREVADVRLRARFATEALRDLRIDALVAAARSVDPARVKALFEHRYGEGGVRVRVRHVLVNDRRKDAEARAEQLHARLQNGESFDALLRESDDRTTRRLLRNEKTAPNAGVLPRYNFVRFGQPFADAVRRLTVGEVSAPVRSSTGYHLIQLLDKQVTELDRVRPALQKELSGGKATRAEIDALRERLFADYEFRSPLLDDSAKAEAANEPDDRAVANGTTTGATTANEPEVADTPAVPPPLGEWPHYRGNPSLHGVARGALSDTPEVAWKFETGGEVMSSPVIADGFVYVGSTDNSVYSIDLRSGQRRWAFPTGDMVEAPALVVDGVVYIGSSDGYLYALDAASGELRWKFQTEDQILGGANYFRLANGALRIVVPSYDARVYCVDAKGKQQWVYETTDQVHGAPAIAGGEVVFGGCDAGLHLVAAATGKPITRIDLGQGCQVAGSVALANDRAWFGHYGNEFLRVHLETGETEWTYENRREGFVSSPAIAKDHIVIGSRDKQLHCIERATGKRLWTFKTRRKVDGSPVICGDKVVFGSGDGRLYLVRLATGDEVWNYDIGRPIFSSPAVVDGMIVVGAGDKRVWAFRAPAGGRK